MKALEIKNLNKSYKDFSLKNVNFSIEEGTIMGLVGANGAGKSTIINCILSVSRFSGEIKIFGKDVDEDVKQEVGFVIDNFLNSFLNAKQVDKIYKNIYKNWDSKKFFDYMNQFEIPFSKKYDQLSKGMRMKFKIACALSSNPQFLILDEPTSGLDPVIRSEILDILLDFVQDESHSVLISSHITSDLEKVADYITYIDDGEVVISSEKYELFEDYGILKCKDEDLKIYRDYIVKIRKGNYSTEALIKNTEEFRKKFKDASVDRSSIDEIMVFYKRGEDYESSTL